MPQMNFDLEDGQEPVSFSLTAADADRFQAFMAECNGYLKRAERLEKLLAAERDRADALATQVERLTAIAEKLSSVAPEYIDHLAADAHLVLRDSPKISLAQRDARVAAEVLRQTAEDLGKEIEGQYFVDYLRERAKSLDEKAAGGDV